MNHQSAGAEELVRKIDYVRDWLNKAEDALRNGNNLVAVSKLSLAKADTTNLLSILVPQPKEERNLCLAITSGVSRRKLAAILMPMLLIACFFIGTAVGTYLQTDATTHVLNNIHGNSPMRSIDRSMPNEGLLTLAMIRPGSIETTIAAVDGLEDEVARFTPPVPRPRAVVYSPGPAPDKIASLPEPVEPEDSGPVMISEEVSQPAEESIDLFGFSLDVIRSARENMGR